MTAVGDEPGEAEAAARLRDAGRGPRRRPPPAAARAAAPPAAAADGGEPGRAAAGPGARSGTRRPGIQAILDRLARRARASTSSRSRTARCRCSAFPPACRRSSPTTRCCARAVDWQAGSAAALAGLGLRRARLASLGRASSGGPGERFDRVQVFSRPRRARRSPSLAPEVAARVRVNPFGLVLPPPADPAREVPGTILFVGNFAHPPNRDARDLAGRRDHARGASPLPEATPADRRNGAAAGDSRAGRPAASRSSPTRPASAPTSRRPRVVLAPVRTGGGMRMKVLQAIGSRQGGGDHRPRHRGLRRLRRGAAAGGRRRRARRSRAATAALLADDARRRALGRAGARASPSAITARTPGPSGSTAVYEEARDRAARSRRWLSAAGQRDHPHPPAPRAAATRAALARRADRGRRAATRSIVSIDASTDGTVEMLEAFEAPYALRRVAAAGAVGPRPATRRSPRRAARW